VPVVCIEHRKADVINSPDSVATRLVKGLDSYFGLN
jgi:hypothetical protein